MSVVRLLRVLPTTRGLPQNLLTEHSKNRALPVMSSRAGVLRESLVPRYGGRLTAQVKLRSEQIPNGKGACQPDGLAWFWDGELIAVFEAKKQQNRGNAIERWYKNNF